MKPDDLNNYQIIDDHSILYVQEFIDAIAIDPNLLGKRLNVQLNDSLSVRIIFPSRKNEENVFGPFEYKDEFAYLNDGKIEWGKQNTLYGIVIIVSYPDVVSDLLESYPEYGTPVNEHTVQALNYIVALCPGCLRRRHDFFLSFWADMRLVQSSAVTMGCRSFHYDKEPRNGYVTEDVIRQAVLNSCSSISDYYELLNNAVRMRVHQDFRSSILACATVSEMVLSRKIREKLVGVDPMIAKAVMSKLNGYDALAGLAKKMGVPIFRERNQARVYELRNRIIHGGYKPVFEDAIIAFQFAKAFLEFYETPIMLETNS